MPGSLYTFQVSRVRQGGDVRWSVARTRWSGLQPTLSAVIASGTLADLSIPPGTPLEQATAIADALATALGKELARHYSDEVEQRP